MKRIPAIALMLLVSFMIMVASCAKKESPGTPYDKLQGKWKLAKEGTDDNDNHIIEPGEVQPVPAAKDYEITFNKDYTGVENNTFNGVVSTPLPFTWSIVGRDSVRCAFSGHDTITYYLVSINSGSLTLQTKTQFGLAWYNYNRK